MKNNVIKLEMYEVVCKCGHVGRSHYVEISFPVKAQSGKEAARIARGLPRVKHDHKNAILNVCRIDQTRFVELMERNSQDPYLHCSCIQDQNLIDLSDRLLAEQKNDSYRTRREKSGRDFYCSKQKIRNAKKYMNHYYNFYEHIDMLA